ncbi:hypothetical protein [Aphanothece sacrum]|uniref:Uncharacterized protein n=1 Tax=Aphanothece sacrum FPU1 TaxID=1920663 RepID=A0A401ILU5_APHSA|nr:hypothetical protein [Aphanothece sacrum]GBF82206.1 hypothetical protein AsFPU1_3634 [Aphanothece sacrum FPU1]GBF87256.1 hypothetical protein AsFPU3_4338 [Aphanothece sacrum FPU3]
MEILTSEILGASKFDQAVLKIGLINICNQESYIGQEMKQLYNAWKDETDEAINNPWLDLHQFIIYVPHPEQQYEGVTLEEGLSLGYNIEVEPVKDRNDVPYNIPDGGHFVVILKQTTPDADFRIAATGIFIRPLALLSLDVVIDPDEGKYQHQLIKHPIIRDYPQGWEQKLSQFINREIRSEDLPYVIGFVDQAENTDYRSPSWSEVYLSGQGFAGF